MSDNKKPDKDHSGSGGDDDGNRFNLSNQQSVEEILPYLWWLIFIVATTSFLALQLFLDAIYEEQYERDVAWIARQSKYMSSVDEDDEDYEDDEDVDDDDDAFYDDDEDEELENLMDGDSEDEEEEMNVEMDAGATSLLDLATCACVPGHHLRMDEVKCRMIYFFHRPNFLVSIPALPKTTMDRGNENADEEVEMEEEEEEEEDEMGNLDGEEKKNPDSANGSSP
ncbi:tumor rejection antigen P815A-like isoform X1 [Mastomys coucha]|uniref:tumor rejection antigen P815A-like isoform X1 n=1 Tax=Mastomys coucha TaxID=35658 RepID=UPI0012622F5A|nr:tumor rejection antigen P815A-like isoform X1 [Mastomys coucha]